MNAGAGEEVVKAIAGLRAVLAEHGENLQAALSAQDEALVDHIINVLDVLDDLSSTVQRQELRLNRIEAKLGLSNRYGTHTSVG